MQHRQQQLLLLLPTTTTATTPPPPLPQPLPPLQQPQQQQQRPRRSGSSAPPAPSGAASPTRSATTPSRTTGPASATAGTRRTPRAACRRSCRTTRSTRSWRCRPRRWRGLLQPRLRRPQAVVELAEEQGALPRPAALREQLYDRNLQVLVGVDGWVGWRAEAAGGTRHGTTLTTRHSQSHAHPCSPPPLCARRCCSACWARTSWSSAASTAARRGEKMGVPVSQGHRCACTPRPGPQVRARPPRRFTQGGVPARVHRHEHAGLTPPGGWTCRAAAAIAGQMQRALGDV